MQRLEVFELKIPERYLTREGMISFSAKKNVKAKENLNGTLSWKIYVSQKTGAIKGLLELLGSIPAEGRILISIKNRKTNMEAYVKVWGSLAYRQFMAVCEAISTLLSELEGNSGGKMNCSYIFIQSLTSHEQKVN